MENKCCFIIPYFGTLPKNFAVFLKTIAANPDFTWLLYTDDHQEFNYPQNIKVSYLTFEQFKEDLDRKFDFHVRLDEPYKLCDLKPAYGYIFEEDIAEYDYWGHCDIDTVVGNLSAFITDQILEQYDKLFCLGHFIIYRNSTEINRLFMCPYKGKKLYREVFSTPEICWFDEEYKEEYNINQIFYDQGKKVYSKDFSANFVTNKFNFSRVKFIGDENGFTYREEGIKRVVYIWENGEVYRIIEHKHKLYKQRFMYLHLQQRKMTFDPTIINAAAFKIIPNHYQAIKAIPTTIQSFKKEARLVVCCQILRVHYRNLRIILGKIKRLGRGKL